MTIRVLKPGVHKLMTKKIETAGEMEVKTVGPDHVLALTIVVRWQHADGNERQGRRLAGVSLWKESLSRP